MILRWGFPQGSASWCISGLEGGWGAVGKPRPEALREEMDTTGGFGAVAVGLEQERVGEVVQPCGGACVGVVFEQRERVVCEAGCLGG